jgi:tetratricopeptide (TPR) repeat protein
MAAIVTIGWAAAGCGVVSHSQNVQGVQLYQQGQYQLATTHFEKAISNDPNAPEGYYNLASTYHRMAKLNNRPEDWKLAEDTYNMCLDRDPNQRDCHRGLAVLLVEQGRSEQAFRLLEGWASSNPTSVDAKVELARLSQEFGNTTAAREHLLEALAINPRDPRALTALGQIHESSGNTTQAIAAYQRSLSNNSMQPDVQARVAALQSATNTPPPLTPPGATRTVNGVTAPPVVR